MDKLPMNMQPLTPLNLPVKKSEGFFYKSKLTRINRLGMQSDLNTRYYVYEWDEKQQKNAKKWIEENE